MRYKLILIGLIFCSSLSMARPDANFRWEPINTADVTIAGEIGRRIEMTVNENIFRLNLERDFIRPFQDKNQNDRSYVGTGKLIDAMVRLSYHTKNQRLIDFKNSLLQSIIRTQLEDGYVGVMRSEHRMWKNYDAHEIAYMINGLIQDYHYFGNQASLDAARKLADYFIAKWPQRPANLAAGVPTTLGAGTAFIHLYEATQDRRYLDFEAETPMGLGHQPLRTWTHSLQGHAYRLLARSLAQLQLYCLEANPNLLLEAKKQIDFIEQEGLPCIFTCTGPGEVFNQEFNGDKGETCATRYLLRLLDMEMRLNGEAHYGDMMERAIFNALFAAQSTDGRHIRYFSPFQAKGELFNRDTYCCPNNFRRAIADLPEYIYYYRCGSDKVPEGVVVNLFTASKAIIPLRDGQSYVNIEQQTNYPASGKVKINIDPSNDGQRFAVLIRMPKWCREKVIKLNGQTINADFLCAGAQGQSYFQLTRRWKKADFIEIEMVMRPRWVIGRKDQRGRVALLRGPIVFSLSRAQNPVLQDMNLLGIYVDPSMSLKFEKDESFRPGGLKCKIKAYSSKERLASEPDLDLVLTEFVDPDSELTYFLYRAGSPEPDELLRDVRRQ